MPSSLSPQFFPVAPVPLVLMTVAVSPSVPVAAAPPSVDKEQPTTPLLLSLLPLLLSLLSAPPEP